MIKKLFPILTIVLVVSHMASDGTWIETRSEMSTMGQCKREKAITEKGFRGDAYEEGHYKVECLKT